MTVEQLFKEWLECHQRYQIKLQTYVRYQCVYRVNIKPQLANKEINQLTKRDIQDFMNHLKNSTSIRTGKELSRSSLNMILAVLKLMFDYAVDFDLLENNPTARVKTMANNKIRMKPTALTKDEQFKIERFIYNLDQDEYLEYFGIIVCLYTGLRIGELIALEWSDIDLNEGIMHIGKTTYTSLNSLGQWQKFTGTPKTKTSDREIPLPDWLIDELIRIKNLNLGQNVIVRCDGKEMSDKLLRWRFNCLLKKLDINHHNFHSLRHTFATRAIENGMDVKTLSEILGHANPNITLSVYTHSMSEHKKLMMQNMNRIWL